MQPRNIKEHVVKHTPENKTVAAIPPTSFGLTSYVENLFVALGGSSFQTLRIYNDPKTVICEILCNFNVTAAAIFSEKLVMAGDDQGNVHRYDISDRSHPKHLTFPSAVGSEKTVTSLAPSCDGEHFFTGHPGYVSIWKGDNTIELAILTPPSNTTPMIYIYMDSSGLLQYRADKVSGSYELAVEKNAGDKLVSQIHALLVSSLPSSVASIVVSYFGCGTTLFQPKLPEIAHEAAAAQNKFGTIKC
jgi:WD40 repeat protein